MNSPVDTSSVAASDGLARNWWLFNLRGIFGVLFGLTALLFPGPTMLSLVILFSAYMLFDGVAGIISAVRAMRRRDQWGFLIFEGLLNIAVGVVALLWPDLTVVAFVLLVAAWAIISGGLMMAAGFRLNISHGRWWLVVGGLCSLIYGALLIAMPLIGAVVLTWWMGAYALVFGISLIILSFQLRSRHRHAVTPSTAGTPA
ncbi:HdeD family acid-resistance protein [Bradyrhizobium sp. SEMIA]|uniref:HdeD family acid-resistance protein n=1 Tax=Bradyrhizobium sp. SEMIA TaxID=2597515 RepID=UPI0018A41F3B|nr:HdeD family acid-resistance protein [Bradyrhizobium sp. SEMIA]QOG23462.1 HdeD family acid-resistance protein [Bradyrhizobium sp. SEMIA]